MSLGLKVFIGKPMDPTSGAWINLPVDDIDELQNIIDKYATEAGEYIISDYETDADIPSLHIDEITSLEDLHNFAEWFENENPDLDVVEALLDVGVDFDELPRKYEEGDFTVIAAENDEEDLGREYIDQLYGGVEQLDQETKIRYFDEDSYRRDLDYEGIEDDEIEEILEEVQDNPEMVDLNMYFDYESFGHDLAIGDNFVFYSSKWVQIY
jgi:antirestriction protein